ncbi:cell division control 73 [Fusarium beomiforme]|uniref:Cell division control 73 n=1 Tax=Fusarium beomiforme TaxID=44412 RepID=A0A9P5DVL8_9HYPO|nr:cell division control 73 [Fusarium beomiforme]
MASAADLDGLVLLRQSISSSAPFIPTASADSSAPEVPLSQATHLRFPDRDVAVPIDHPTRFVSQDKPVDLRSIYFAWLNREVAIPEYNASAMKLNDELAATGGSGKVQNLGFIERLDLITWLEGASEESEYIKPLASDKDAAAAGMTAAVKTVTSTAQSRSGRGTMDPRLAGIYNGERKMGDRNTVLRGIKPTDFSHVRKLAAPFIQKKSQSSSSIPTNPSLAINSKPPTRRPDPIILLSPSASSLLRLSNARSFLEDGKFVPTDAGSASSNMLHVQRVIPSIDPNRPMRFILVEGSEAFKPEYWNRIVAVLTTGQTWQFKNYKWSDPNELFKHTLGIYVGWRGESAPDNIRSWGHRVLSTGIDRWRGDGHDASRFRDKEIVEQIWRAIEENMRYRGWRKDRAPSSI